VLLAPKTGSCTRDSRRTGTQKLRPVWPASLCLSQVEKARDKQYVGAVIAETRHHPARGERFEGLNPKSAVGMKQGRRGLAGSKPSRG
jgi:hypothetical protein